MTTLPQPGHPIAGQAQRVGARTVVITGAAAGIGAASARAFAEEGAHVYVADVDVGNGAATAAALEGAGTFVRCDVTDESDVLGLIERAVAERGRVDVLMANAAIEWPKAILDTELADWLRVLDVNLTGVYLAARFALRRMVEQGEGAIVITSSPHAINTVPDAGAYAASKGGTLALMRALALEGAPHGVRVNALLPGAIDTPMLRREATLSRNPAEQIRRLGMIHPLARLGRPEEVAACALFLASDEASFVTGTVLSVDGGLLAAQPGGPPVPYND